MAQLKDTIVLGDLSVTGTIYGQADASLITTGTLPATRIPAINNLTGFSTYVYSATNSRTANTVLAAPNGSAGVASFRKLVASDIPSLDTSKITSGTLPIARGGTGGTSAQDATWNLLHVADPGNLNNAKRMGNFKISNTTTNTPVANMWGATWNIVDDSASGNNGTSGTTWQLIFQSASTDMWLRTITNAGGWSAYKRVWTEGNTVTGAVWNDYAEYRQAETNEPGRCVKESPTGIMKLTTKRMEKGCEIISDTFGFAIGETEKCKSPVAAAGRVLAYTDKPRETFELGMPVCSGPNGTVSQMTEEEARQYPWCIIGTVSEIPNYEEWGGGEGADRDPVKVDNRIWIRVR